MKCPKCDIDLFDKCCPRCGYLENGNKVELSYKPEKFIDEKNINKEFDKLYRNENSLVATFFGGFYLAFHKCVLSALLINIIEYLLFILVNYYIGRIPYIGVYTPIILFILFIVFRMFMGATSNTIILYFDKVKIKYYKRKYPNDYKRHLFKYKNKSIVTLILYSILYIALFLLLFTDTFK